MRWPLRAGTPVILPGIPPTVWRAFGVQRRFIAVNWTARVLAAVFDTVGRTFGVERVEATVGQTSGILTLEIKAVGWTIWIERIVVAICRLYFQGLGLATPGVHLAHLWVIARDGLAEELHALTEGAEGRGGFQGRHLLPRREGQVVGGRAFRAFVEAFTWW